MTVLAAVVLSLASTGADQSWCNADPAPELAALPVVAAADDWFKVHSVAPGVFAISEPRQYEGVTSFLIVGSRRAVLFDTGLGVVGIDRVVRQLTAMPVTVINSHTHFDHVGGNRGFADVRNLDHPFSIASSRGDVGAALREYASDTLAEDRVCGPLPDSVRSREYAIPTWRTSGNVSDGEVLDLGGRGRTLQVLRTPGHTPDSLVLLDRANGLLFTGDTYYSGDIYLWSPETNVADYTASIDKLARLVPGLKMLLPAHGPPMAEPRRLLELRQALLGIQTGIVSSEPADEGRRLYRFEHFSILMAGPGSGNQP